MKTTKPNQRDVDSIASFVEACAELEREPFFGKDEKLSFQTAGEQWTFKLGDRFHFRSALISFRRVWMPNEPSSLERVLKILVAAGLPELFVEFAKHHSGQVQRILSEPRHLPNVEMPAERIINLWLNTVFAHGGIEGRNRRVDFENAVAKFGHARFEFCFRSLVRSLGFEYLNIANLAAKPALDHLQRELGLSPSFKIGSAFGIKRKEKTPEGHIIIREGSSEYFSEETFEERFSRMAARQENRELAFVLQNLDRTATELLRGILKSTSIGDLISNVGGNLTVEPTDLNKFPNLPGFRASAGVTNGRASSRVNVYDDCQVRTDDNGVAGLNAALVSFKKQLLES